MAELFEWMKQEREDVPKEGLAQLHEVDSAGDAAEEDAVVTPEVTVETGVLPLHMCFFSVN